MSRSLPSFHFSLTTPPAPGAVAIVQIHGGDAIDLRNLLGELTGKHKPTDWPVGRVCLISFAGIDEGLAVVLGDGETAIAQLMPHGGPRVVQKLIDALIASGGQWEQSPDARTLYPEATSDIEADMLAILARAASPAAIDLLAAQPRLWLEWLNENDTSQSQSTTHILSRSAALDQLVTPPTVVVMGKPNVGKSTLVNRLTGRNASIVADLPGTTRDWVGSLVLLNQIAVQWIDTPGVRQSDDPIEQAAIALSRNVIDKADVLIALCDLDTPFPDTTPLKQPPDLWVRNKVDHATPAPSPQIHHRDAPLNISAKTGRGLDELEQAILKTLGLDRLSGEERWAFSPTLKQVVTSGNLDLLKVYIKQDGI